MRSGCRGSMVIGNIRRSACMAHLSQGPSGLAPSCGHGNALPRHVLLLFAVIVTQNEMLLRFIRYDYKSLLNINGSL